MGSKRFFQDVQCGVRYAGTYCRLAAGHNGAHAGLKDNLTVLWTNEDMREARITRAKEPLVGWRCWTLSKHDKLKSTAAQYEWEGPVATTKEGMRVMSQHVATKQMVRKGCDYGVYSFKSPKQIRTQFEPTVGWVVGRLENYGHVVEHEFGYRAQFAIVRELWLLTNDDPYRQILIPSVISTLESRYQCPVHSLDTKQLAGWARYFEKEET